MSQNKPLATAALSSLIALCTGATLISCTDHHHTIRCYGTNKNNPDGFILMSKGACKKIDGGIIKAATHAEVKQFKPFPSATYIKCYGIAASSRNDCGTKSTACAGSEAQARAADAWIALPESLCKTVGGRAVKPKH